MKNSIIAEYIYRLNLNLKTINNQELKSRVIQLIRDLEQPDLSSIEQLYKLLLNVQQEPALNTSFFNPPYPIKIWIDNRVNDLAHLLANIERFKYQLNELHFPNRLYPLFTLLQSVTSHTHFGFHINTPSLVAQIENMSAIFNHLDKVEEAPQSTAIHAGDFAALIPLNAEHAFCLKLLHDLTVASSTGTDVIERNCNSFLQSLLLIHKDLYHVKHQKDLEKSTNNTSTSPNCTLI